MSSEKSMMRPCGLGGETGRGMCKTFHWAENCFTVMVSPLDDDLADLCAARQYSSRASSRLGVLAASYPHLDSDIAVRVLMERASILVNEAPRSPAKVN